MTILEAIVLGILQGLTEFLPVSSSGHLVLMQHFLGLKEPQVFFDVMLHLGTLGAVVVVYYQSIWDLVQTSLSTIVNSSFYRRPIHTVNNSSDLKLVWFILLGSIPTGLIAVLFQNQLEAIFAKPAIVAMMLIVSTKSPFPDPRVVALTAKRGTLPLMACLPTNESIAATAAVRWHSC